ncbi:hypothetical protein NEL66_24925 [Escherichia coli]|nr:hypothetical protein [Escherichia coli]KXL70673.1 hypothetical protein AUS12_26335 [Escherichia coli]KXM50623.1 hypothetical protein AUS28_27475 [Escherichia coli]MDI0862142.1 hypothetical protein [Escherichia coli]MDI0880551.1 hypothetical protein [Escherichia coli]MED9326304.1 hypothetical protein [Escherichia coli]
MTLTRLYDFLALVSKSGAAKMFHNAAWGVRALWFELVTKIDMDIHKKNRYASYDLRRKIEMQHEEFQKMTEREQVPLLKSPE